MIEHADLPDTTSGDALISASHVTVSYGSTRVLDDVAVDVARAEWLSIIGPNGAGKSTLLRVLAGLIATDPPVVVAGTPLLAAKARERARLIGYVAQVPVFPRGMSLLDYVLLGRTPHLSILGVEGPSDVALVRHVLESLDLTELAGRSVSTLSGGEAQRASLARAVAQEPEVLLLDEPTSSLDLGHQQEVLQVVDQLRVERGLTVISTMHDLTLAGDYADRLLLLDHGHVKANGTATEVLDAGVLAATYGTAVEVIQHDGRLVVLPTRADR